MYSRCIIALLAASTLPFVTTGCHAAASASEPQRNSSVTWLTPDQIKTAQIEVAAVGEHPMDETVATTGRVTFDDLRVAHVYSPVTGRVASVNAALGQRLKRGAPLATIVSPSIGQWSSDVNKAQADLIAAEHDLKRKTELLAVKAVARADYEASEDAYRQAKAEQERAQQKSQLLRGNGGSSVSQGYTLTTPIDGEVIARQLNPGIEVQGQYDSGNAGVELFTVGELDKVWVVADVYEMDIARVKIGAKANVNVVAYPGKTFVGTVDWVSGALDPTSRTAKIRCSLDNPDRLLKPEMYATVTISVDETKALALPKGAVLRLGEQTVVFVETGTTPEGKLKFERAPVQVDEGEGGEWLLVEHGLDKGMKVVTQGAILLAGMI